MCEISQWVSEHCTETCNHEPEETNYNRTLKSRISDMVRNSFLTPSDPESSADSALANDFKAIRLNSSIPCRIHHFPSSDRISLVDF